MKMNLQLMGGGGSGLSGGGAGNAGGEGRTTDGVPAFDKLPDALLEGGKITKRADEVFEREYTDRRIAAREWIEMGVYDLTGAASMHSVADEDVFSVPMLKGMQSKLNSELKSVNSSEKMGVITSAKAKQYRYALTMLQNEINDYYRKMYLE